MEDVKEAGEGEEEEEELTHAETTGEGNDAEAAAKDDEVVIVKGEVNLRELAVTIRGWVDGVGEA